MTNIPQLMKSCQLTNTHQLTNVHQQVDKCQLQIEVYQYFILSCLNAKISSYVTHAILIYSILPHNAKIASCVMRSVLRTSKLMQMIYLLLFWLDPNSFRFCVNATHLLHEQIHANDPPILLFTANGKIHS